MRYADVRDQIDTGDLVAVRGRRGLRAAFLRWMTRSPYTHVGIAVWVGTGGARRLLLAEQAAVGASLVALSTYAGEDFDVYAVPRYIALMVDDAIWQVLRNHPGYRIGDWIRLALDRLFGLARLEVGDEQTVSASFAATVWLRAGWVPVDLPQIPTPADVAHAQGVPPRFEVRAVDQWAR